MPKKPSSCRASLKKGKNKSAPTTGLRTQENVRIDTTLLSELSEQMTTNPD